MEVRILLQKWSQPIVSPINHHSVIQYWRKSFQLDQTKTIFCDPFILQNTYILKKALQLPWTKTRFSDPLWYRAGTLCYDSSQRQVHLPKERFLGEQRNAEYCSLSSEGAEVSHTYLTYSFGIAKDQIQFSDTLRYNSKRIKLPIVWG